MDDIFKMFVHFLNISLTASWLILAVVLLRVILKKAPKWINCLLWGIVGIRLVVPFSVESIFSLIPSSEVVSPDIIYSTSPSVSTGIPAMNTVINPVISQTFAPDPSGSVNPLQIVGTVAGLIWVVGIVTMLIYVAVCFLTLKIKMRTAVRYDGNIYQSESVQSPFILGVFRPKIYLPFGLDEKSMDYIVSHENAHLKRKDHWIKPFAFLILSVYWFNPLVWAAYVLLCRDIELACDEKAVKDMMLQERREYSLVLVQNSMHRRMVAACPLAFGEVGIKERVKSVMNYKKPAFWLVIVAVVSCIAVSVCFLTNPVENNPIETGKYKVEETLYSTENTGNTEYHYFITDGYELQKMNIKYDVWETVGQLKKINLSAHELQSYAKTPEAWKTNYTAEKITEAYATNSGEEPTFEKSVLIAKTRSGDTLLAVLEGSEIEEETVKLTSLVKLEPYKSESEIIYETDLKEDEISFAIETALINQLPAPEGSKENLSFTGVSFAIVGEEAKTNSNGKETSETLAVLFQRYRYNYKDDRLTENGESGRAIVELQYREDGIAVKECTEFKLDGTEKDFEEKFSSLAGKNAESPDLIGSLYEECRQKALSHYGLIEWKFMPMLSATGWSHFPITFSMDYDRIDVQCSDGYFIDLDAVNYNEEQKTGTSLSFERGHNVYWSPKNEKGEDVTKAELSFQVFLDNEIIYQDTIHVSASESDSGKLQRRYIAKMPESELIMVQNDNGALVRIDSISNQIVFYTEPFSETETNRTAIASIPLVSSEIGRLKQIVGKAEWLDDHYVSRVRFTFDGEFVFDDGVRYYFSDEFNKLYYDHYLAEISEEDMDFIMSRQKVKFYTHRNDYDSASLELNLESQTYSFSYSVLSSHLSFGDYFETDKTLVLKEDDSDRVYTFNKKGQNLIFDAKNSTLMPTYNYGDFFGDLVPVKDGAIFSR